MNVATLLEDQAKALPGKAAIICNGKKTTFQQLDETVNRFANYFAKKGISSGDRVLVFILPSAELTATMFGLFKMGAVPVVIDPGMGVKNLLKAIEEVSPQAVIGISKAFVLSALFRKSFRTARIKLKSETLMEKSSGEPGAFTARDMGVDEPAAILFTSGGTGTPKGVVYTHKIFTAQTALLQKMFSLTPDDIGYACFFLFTFFSLGLGMSSYFPSVDMSKAARAKPETLVREITESGASFVSGSPAFWMRTAEYCLARGITLPRVKSLVMFGAPVQVATHEKWRAILPNGTTYSPYGATESLPVSNISGDYILKHTAKETDAGAGTCVGKTVDTVEAGIINSDEIVVSGDVVTREYYNNEKATRESKLFKDGKMWHIIGDVGRIDEEGRIWFYGRKAHVVDIPGARMYPIPCEAVFNRHPGIKRCALIGPSVGGSVIPSLVIERNDGGTKMTEAFLKELHEIRDKHEHTRPIEKFYLKKTFPVDIRHNIKIDRIALRAWAEGRSN
ncbi:MAG: fatty acid CoA ligase family protein [Oscillospiraceae bacterium]|nr:fatty acid CoA ligase family protein [Oscillospiraceae bacterium]